MFLKTDVETEPTDVENGPVVEAPVVTHAVGRQVLSIQKAIPPLWCIKHAGRTALGLVFV